MLNVHAGYASLALLPKRYSIEKWFPVSPRETPARQTLPIVPQENAMTPADQLDRLVFYTLLLSGAVALYPW